MTTDILIFTGTTGAGHTYAANSLKYYLEKNGYSVKIVDGFAEGSKLIGKTVSEGYEQLVDYFPKVYRKMYNIFDQNSRFTETVLRSGSRILRNSILKDIEKYNPKLIISTHPIITNFLGRYKDHGLFDKPVLAVVTDFIIHEIYIRDSINAYLVASDYTKDMMIGRGVEPKKIFNYGIPIRKDFLEQHHSQNKKPSILVMGGSLGSKGLLKTFKSLLKLQIPVKITVVCGNNKHLKTRFDEYLKTVDTDKDVEVLGFTQEIPKLMNNSDMIVTKPGGLTSSEAISTETPLIIPFTYPGQEEFNADFLVKSNMAVRPESFKDLTETVDFLLDNRNVIDMMKTRMQEEKSQYSVKDTVQLCDQLMLENI